MGFSFNAQFTDEKVACLVIEEDAIYAMLLTEPFFRTFTPRAVADAKQSTEVLLPSVREQEEVDGLVAKASQSGGKALREPKDHGFMYQHAFEDPDGHIWELVHMGGKPAA